MRCDIDEAYDVRIVTGLRDKCSAITVTDEDDWPVLHCEHPVDRSKVVADGGQRVLCDRDLIAILYKDVVDGFPSRASDKSPVHEDHVANWRRGGTERHGE